MFFNKKVFKANLNLKVMKKTLMLIVLMLVFSVGVISAKTLIAGKIYNADFTDTISGADVMVNCNGNIQTTESLSDGAYSVTFNETGTNACNNGDTLTVSATKGNLYGSETGIIHDNAFGDWDLAIVNVPLVPEFSLIIGSLTILSAVGIFFFVRRE
ncbi:MAG: hypothetical protein QT05_C0001G0017 [archaeon GW2011_AR13]|nr:MAG: hypothetical protein QT05_C0001G0017 [archaeon GW2011_AR13]